MKILKILKRNDQKSDDKSSKIFHNICLRQVSETTPLISKFMVKNLTARVVNLSLGQIITVS